MEFFFDEAKSFLFCIPYALIGQIWPKLLGFSIFHDYKVVRIVATEFPKNHVYGARVATFSVKPYEFDPSLPTGVELPTAVYICFPTNEAGALIAIWPGGSSREGTLASPGKPPMCQNAQVRGWSGLSVH